MISHYFTVTNESSYNQVELSFNLMAPATRTVRLHVMTLDGQVFFQGISTNKGATIQIDGQNINASGYTNGTVLHGTKGGLPPFVW